MWADLSDPIHVQHRAGQADGKLCTILAFYTDFTRQLPRQHLETIKHGMLQVQQFDLFWLQLRLLA